MLSLRATVALGFIDVWSMAASRRELAPLLLLETGDADEVDDSGLSEMECLHTSSTRSVLLKNAISAKDKHVGVFTVIAFAIMAVVALIFFRSTGNPLRASVQALTRFADGTVNGTCAAPKDFCQGKFSWTDCDADGIPDPYCVDPIGYCGCVGSSNQCEQRETPCLPGALLCERPSGWCAGPGKDHTGAWRSDAYVYSSRDCDGDGQPDPFCQKSDSRTGDFDCGCLQSSNGCFDTFPALCPDMRVAPMITLPRTNREVALNSEYSGILMYLNARVNQRVAAGEDLFAVIDALDGTTIRRTTSPAGGIISDVLTLHAGDLITAGERVIILDPSGAETVEPPMFPTPVPTPVPATPAPTSTVVATVPTPVVFETESPTPAPTPRPAPASTTPLPTLKGCTGKHLVASGFKGSQSFKGWGSEQFRVGLYVFGSTTFASFHGPGGTVDVKMPEDGVITSLQHLKSGGKVNVGGQLACYTPATAGIKLPEDHSVAMLNNPAAGTFKRWLVGVGDKLPDGGGVAEFDGPDGKASTVHWDGPTGMVFAKQKLSPFTGLKKDADLVTIGAGIFSSYTVKPGDNVSKGDSICTLKVGADSIDIPAQQGGTVVSLSSMRPGDKIGFDFMEGKQSCCLVSGHLPRLHVPKLSPAAVKAGKAPANITHAPDSWINCTTWMVRNGAKVENGEGIALARKIYPNGSNGPIQEVKAEATGFISYVNSICTGKVIGPHDDLAIIDNKPRRAFPWPLVLGVISACCLLLAYMAFCRQEMSTEMPSQKPPSPPQAVTPAPLRPDPAPDPAPAPAPAPAPRPAPAPISQAPTNLAPVLAPAPAPMPMPEPTPVEAGPQGVPLYFDFKPYYFQYHPIGIKFYSKAPIKIEQFIFNSYGRTLGLREGQRLTKIKNVDVREDQDYHHIDSLLIDAIKDLPYWPLRIDFRTQAGDIRRYDFEERPLGILFSQHLPIKVEKFKPYSLAQGKKVEVGWEIVRVADQDTSINGMAAIGITDNHSGYRHVDKCLLEGLKHLPFWKVRIDFKTQEGQVKTFEFGEKPLGIMFTKQSPIRIEMFRHNSLAQQLGVQIGWEIVRIGDDDLRPEYDFKRVDQMLEGYLQHLPERKRHSL